MSDLHSESAEYNYSILFNTYPGLQVPLCKPAGLLPSGDNIYQDVSAF